MAPPWSYRNWVQSHGAPGRCVQNCKIEKRVKLVDTSVIKKGKEKGKGEEEEEEKKDIY
jgi:hypothetical protein